MKLENESWKMGNATVSAASAGWRCRAAGADEMPLGVLGPLAVQVGRADGEKVPFFADFGVGTGKKPIFTQKLAKLPWKVSQSAPNKRLLRRDQCLSRRDQCLLRRDQCLSEAKKALSFNELVKKRQFLGLVDRQDAKNAKMKTKETADRNWLKEIAWRPLRLGGLDFQFAL